MAQRSVWRGAISFGLIYVPVEMHTAARDGSMHLHLLDSRDFAAVGYERVNKKTGKSVEWSNIVKGYEYEKGKYVALSDSDFKHANVKATETIEVSSFTEAADVPPIYFDTPYYLAPAKGGAKVYALLREALQATHKVAVATFVMRGRQHLCVVTPQDRSLMLITLRFSDELLPADGMELPAASLKAAGVTTAELSMAEKLVEQMSSPWDPSAFKDTYRADLLRRIQEKIRKKQVHALADDDAPADEKPKAQVIDLMEALRNSLKSKERPAARPGTKGRKRA